MKHNFEEQFDPEFEGVPMWDQLGKILDSEHTEEVVDPIKFHPVCTVITDDNLKYHIDFDMAKKIRAIVLSLPVPKRRIIFRDLQTSKGLERILRAIQILENRGISK